MPAEECSTCGPNFAKSRIDPFVGIYGECNLVKRSRLSRLSWLLGAL